MDYAWRWTLKGFVPFFSDNEEDERTISRLLFSLVLTFLTAVTAADDDEWKRGMCHYLHSSVSEVSSDGEQSTHLIRTQNQITENQTETRKREYWVLFWCHSLARQIKQHESRLNNLDSNSTLNFHNAWLSGIARETFSGWLISNGRSSIPIVRFHWCLVLPCWSSSSKPIARCDFAESEIDRSKRCSRRSLVRERYFECTRFSFS